MTRVTANSFERARTIDNQEACSNGKPTDGSFEFSTRIKNSTSTDLNELYETQTKSEQRDSANSTMLLGGGSQSASNNPSQTVTAVLAAATVTTNSTFIQQFSSSIALGGKKTAASSLVNNLKPIPNVNSSSSQIAPELSELVIYTQAVKFRDLNLIPINLASRTATTAAAATRTTSYSRKSIMLKSNNNGSSNVAKQMPPSSLNTSQQLTNQMSVTSSDLTGSRLDLSQQPSSGVSATRNTRSTVADDNNYSHQIVSLNESKAKQICKKRPVDVIQHTETQLIRCYPNARRFDSSNFSPVTFWSCGMQLIALNYQTIDSSQILNSALFEQNNMAGYVLKPPQLWSRAHSEYGRFNPFEKKKDAEYVSLNLRLISGQYLTETLFGSGQGATRESLGLSGGGGSGQEGAAGVMQGDHRGGGTGAGNLADHLLMQHGGGAGDMTFMGGLLGHQQQQYYHRHRNSCVELLQATSTCVEVEVIGIPCDCAKEKTKTFNRNALNPIWNEDFMFHIVFPDLAFIRFSVIDANNNHTISQRVIPVRHILSGYRHIRLRNMQNQALELASLFIYTRRQLEHVADSNQHSPSTTSLHGAGGQSRQSQQLGGGLMSSTADNFFSLKNIIKFFYFLQLLTIFLS